MNTNRKNYFLVAFLLVLFFPFKMVFAQSTTVTNQETLKQALSDESITEIILGNDIDTTEKINITRPVTIDGKGHTMKYVGTFKGGSDNKVWDGIYVLQVYKTTATIRDIKLTGGNAALLVNGSKVTFEGKIDVSGNGFGGIELGQGVGVEETNYLELEDNADIVNSSEDADRPTLWVPNDSDAAVLVKDGEEETINAGEELTLVEIENIFEEQPSPQTKDNTILYLTLGFISAVILFYTVPTYLKEI